MLFVFLIISLSISQELDEGKPYTVYVKQSGSETHTGTEIGQEKKSLKSAYYLLGDDEACKIYVVNDETAFTAEAVQFYKNQGISIEGVNSDGNGNTIVSIDCDVHPERYLFSCGGVTKFNYLAFIFPTTLNRNGEDPFIYGGSGELTIKNCQFIRPPFDGSTVNYYLVHMHGGNLNMDSVECVDDYSTVAFSRNPFYLLFAGTVSLTNVTLKKIKSNIPTVFIYGETVNKIDVTMSNSTFTECQSRSEGTVYFESRNSESSFSVGDAGVTSFSSCTGIKSGGIYLNLSNARSASKLIWPIDGKNLVFQNCSSEYNGVKRNTGLYFEMNNDSLFKDIADAMKESFAADYTRDDNLWFVVGYDNKTKKECDFISTYFDPPPPKPDNMTRAFVKNGGRGNGIDVNSAIDSIYDAYEYLEKSGKCFIDVVKTSDPIKAEAISFSINSGITIEGVHSDGDGNIEVAINCDVSVSSFLFSCQRIVEFKYLAFQFSSTEKNWDSLISAGSGSISLKISTCRFVRIGSQSQEGMMANDNGNSPLESSLVSVAYGSVEMDTVKCTDETSFVTFSSSPFSFSGAREVSLSGMDISKVNVESGAAISIDDGSNSSSKVSIEGLNVQEVKSEKGAAAGLDITLSSEESRVAIGRKEDQITNRK
ncbi:uncharacterized protein MONOS_13428 [Monocercomonoides exilis]|uniref:uncharacterized protein n=1 Tax=Monocercomonoides exilis TaxID=2049356 RepID=UPI0035598DEC|nr:hypothetical protein MONOS_13428 [Monocercomonoides exilis]|eukprot:MONOS_13428.1-p1 / transcript=MONOS_13428.1 / gene=MONOS_13428 / organism=Monocercomonoides_exilis_PA203 / gene_product=unspecified product / transcript_product=unspecified product / location=Mono_scaffold00827:19909-22614(+) / protein_length=652 / sequence_SO=supercontig / SO=protein_coding / is_pseudo=false